MKGRIEKSEYVRREYARLALNYDKRWDSYVAATVRETIKRINLNSAESLLDVGCGTGAFLNAVHSKFPKVEMTGVDLSEEMLSVARQKLEGCVSFQRASAEELPFDDKSFDMVVSCSAFHFFEKPVQALREFHRVLKPKGRIVVTDWCNNYLSCQIHDLFLRLFNRGHSRTYCVKEIKSIFKEAGFETIKTERYKLDWLWGMMTVQTA